MKIPNCQTLRLILGDQLNSQHSWFSSTDDSVLYVIAELRQETQYVRHHVQKICAFFLAMERFAEHLAQQGHQVIHLTLDETTNFESLPALIEHLCNQAGASRFEYQQPDEYRLHKQLTDLELKKIEIQCRESEHFLVPFDSLGKYFKKGKAQRMETFYRKMRKQTGYLMQGNGPVGGDWNYDQKNRNKLKPADLKLIPEPLIFANDVSDILARLKKHEAEYFGDEAVSLLWPVDREQGLTILDYFCNHQLAQFGRFQDAMTMATPHKWSLYHSRISFAMNAKLISPNEVIEAAIKAFETNDNIDIAQIEGFVRQILGWREFVRGIYWLNMPDYGTANYLSATRSLPEFYWTADTKMNCMKEVIGQSLGYAFAHHIQRLMVTGTFGLLYGIHPDEMDSWYLGIYIDALEWVEMPNTRGMSQYADGGLLASKPYAASGNYIQKMSDYCKACDYDVKAKTEDSACPFNSLYWGFMVEHRDKLESNPRIGMVYRNWDKQETDQQEAVLKRAEWCKANPDAL